MRRFLIEEIKEKDGFCVIPEPEARHIVKVLRMKQGDRLILMDSRGERFEASIEEVSRRDLVARLIRKLPKPPESPVSIDICQAVIRPRVMDYMIERTSELGVSRIIPFYSERTVIKLEDSRLSQKMRHWREISRSSAKQSGRLIPVNISEPVLFKELLHDFEKREGLKVVLWEGEIARDLKGILRSVDPAYQFTGVIGPEGGFSRDEIDKLRDAGFIPVSLGSRILRAETAAIALISIVQYEWGDLGIKDSEERGIAG